MPTRKLTPGEITAAVEKIRRRYDEYIVKYYKPQSLRRAFEERYLRALRSSVDISSFLLAEISAVEELARREEERAASRAEAEPPAESFADKVLEEHRRKIAHYPLVEFHPDASEELQRLVGGLRHLSDQHWPGLSQALRDTASNMNSLEMLNLDSQLRYLSSPERDGMPPFLSRYVGQLRRFPRNHAVIDREEKEYILQAAFFLNDLFTVLERVRRLYKDLSEAARQTLETVLGYVWGLISDFRLKDLKRRKTSSDET